MTRIATLLLVTAATVFAQAATFEVVSVKRDPNQDNGSRFQFLPGGRFTARVWVQQLVELAYDVKDYQVSGPDWIRADRYLVEARSPMADPTLEQKRSMLQAMLADRFQLKVRLEKKEFPSYALVVDKGGAKVTPFKPGEHDGCTRDNTSVCGIHTMAQLADQLRYDVGKPVFDQTGIQGEYHLLLAFDEYEATNRTPPPGYNKPPLPVALREQLGLKLEPQKTTLPFLVIENIQRPTDN